MDLASLASGRPLGGLAPAPLAIDAAADAAAAALLPAGPAYVGLAPGAGGRHKCWPLDRFIALGAAQAERGRVPVFLLGPGEAGWAEAVAAALPTALLPLQRVATVTPLLTIALGRRLAAAVANDSGTGHMLAAADRPLLSLFGPTPAAKFAPDTPRGRVIRAQDFGAETMDAIPLAAVETALAGMMAL